MKPFDQLVLQRIRGFVFIIINRLWVNNINRFLIVVLPHIAYVVCVGACLLFGSKTVR